MPHLVAIFLAYPVGKDQESIFHVFELPQPPVTQQEQVAAIRRATVVAILELAGRNLMPLELPDGFVEAVEAREYEGALDLWRTRAGYRTGYSRISLIEVTPTHEGVQQALTAFRAKGGGA